MMVLQVSERLRLQLLKEEFKLRKKQPQAWTAQKYRKYANIGMKKKKEKPEFIEEEKELEARLLKETPKHAKKAKRKKAFKRAKKSVKKQKKVLRARARKGKKSVARRKKKHAKARARKKKKR